MNEFMEVIELNPNIWLFREYIRTRKQDGFRMIYTIHCHGKARWTQKLDDYWTPCLDQCLKIRAKTKCDLDCMVTSILGNYLREDNCGN